eukprot:scaffold74416_cov41-Cyclotella_meneghiniana.AAC.6
MSDEQQSGKKRRKRKSPLDQQIQMLQMQRGNINGSETINFGVIPNVSSSGHASSSTMVNIPMNADNNVGRRGRPSKFNRMISHYKNISSNAETSMNRNEENITQNIIISEEVFNKDTDDEALNLNASNAKAKTVPDEVGSSLLPSAVASATVESVFNEDTDDDEVEGLNASNATTKPEDVRSSLLPSAVASAAVESVFNEDTDDEVEGLNASNATTEPEEVRSKFRVSAVFDMLMRRKREKMQTMKSSIV